MYQKLTIVGNLGKDPEMRYTPTGQAVTNFNVATSRQHTDQGGQLVKETTWFRVFVWGKQAEACNQYLKKCSKVLVDGRLNPDPKTGGPRIWQSKEGAAASFEVTASDVRFLSSANEREHEQQSAQSAGYEGEDVPF